MAPLVLAGGDNGACRVTSAEADPGDAATLPRSASLSPCGRTAESSSSIGSHRTAVSDRCGGPQELHRQGWGWECDLVGIPPCLTRHGLFAINQRIAGRVWEGERGCPLDCVTANDGVRGCMMKAGGGRFQLLGVRGSLPREGGASGSWLKSTSLKASLWTSLCDDSSARCSRKTSSRMSSGTRTT